MDRRYKILYSSIAMSLYLATDVIMNNILIVIIFESLYQREYPSFECVEIRPQHGPFVLRRTVY